MRKLAGRVRYGVGIGIGFLILLLLWLDSYVLEQEEFDDLIDRVMNDGPEEWDVAGGP